jgi:hypothetical protein
MVLLLRADGYESLARARTALSGAIETAYPAARDWKVVRRLVSVRVASKFMGSLA